MNLIRGLLKVTFEELGEGLSGDFNSDDPTDIELLRFYFMRFEEDETGNWSWNDLQDGSYCTQVPVSTSVEQQQALLTYLMDAAERDILRDSYKRKLEKLSWVAPEWLLGDSSMLESVHTYVAAN